jgi:hypothetical protein
MSKQKKMDPDLTAKVMFSGLIWSESGVNTDFFTEGNEGNKGGENSCVNKMDFRFESGVVAAAFQNASAWARV